jgi:hypothetical protein
MIEIMTLLSLYIFGIHRYQQETAPDIHKIIIIKLVQLAKHNTTQHNTTQHNTKNNQSKTKQGSGEKAKHNLH